MKKIMHALLHPPVDGPAAILLLRLMAGSVFTWEGLLKFVYPNQGVGRFTKLGFPSPDVLAHFVAVGEIVGGLLLIFGLLTRVTAIYFTLQMIVAILSTKIGVLMGTSPLPLPTAPPQTGFWAMLHEIRTDYAQLMCCIFFAIAGPGRRSIDAGISSKSAAEQ
jgi:putative oxidoreductase